jgi:hypothetical protein
MRTISVNIATNQNLNMTFGRVLSVAVYFTFTKGKRPSAANCAKKGTERKGERANSQISNNSKRNGRRQTIAGKRGRFKERSSVSIRTFFSVMNVFAWYAIATCLIPRRRFVDVVFLLVCVEQVGLSVCTLVQKYEPICVLMRTSTYIYIL